MPKWHLVVAEPFVAAHSKRSCTRKHAAHDFFFFKQKTAYEITASDWSSDVCSSDLAVRFGEQAEAGALPEQAIQRPAVVAVRVRVRADERGVAAVAVGQEELAVPLLVADAPGQQHQGRDDEGGERPRDDV